MSDLQNQSKRELADALEQLRSVVNSVADGIITVDRRGTITTFNTAAERIFGYSTAEVLGKNLELLLPESLQGEQDRGIAADLRAGPAKVMGIRREGVGRRKDGSLFRLDLVVSEFLLGKEQYFTGIVRDITARERGENELRENKERHRLLVQGTKDNALMLAPAGTDSDDLKRAEQELRRTSDLLRAVAEGTSDAVFVKDKAGRYLLFNAAACRFVGKAAEDVLGRDDHALFGPADARRIMDRDRRVMESGQSQTDEEELTVAGVTRVFLATKAPYRDNRGNVIGVVGISRDITDRKRAEQALRESEARKAAILETALDCIITVDHGGKVVEFNPAAERTFGFRREQVIGQELANFIIPPRFRDLHRKGIARYLATGEGEVLGRRLEFPALRVDGSEFPVEIAFTRIPIEGPPLFTAYLRDITEAKRAEAAILEQERRSRTILESITDAFFALDRDWRFTYVNKQAEVLLRRTRGELLGASYWEEFASAIGTDFDRNYRRAVTENQAVTFEAFYPPHDCWYEVHAYPSAEGLSVYFRDLTRRRETEKGLHLRDRAIQAVSEGILITDPGQPDNPIIFASPGFERITGYSPEEAVGRNCRFLQGPDTDKNSVAQLREAIQAGHPCTVELINHRKDGSPFWNAVSISPVYDERGELTHFVGVQADVTARRELEEQFRQAQKMEAVGNLAGGVAHDFNNLLTVINGCSELIQSQLPEPSPVRDLAREIGHAGERAASLTQQLLAFSRKQVLEPKVLNLNSIVTHTAKMLKRLIGEDIDLGTALDSSLGHIKADPGQIEQILVNLSVNARDAMPQGGKLTIETANVELDKTFAQAYADIRPGPYVMLAVSDTGTGMDDKTMAHVFEPFFTTKEGGKGTGLGLATVFGIVKQSGGHLAVYSEPGHGTTFKLYLPRIQEPVSAGKSHPSVKSASQGNETILLVEDEPALLTLSRRILQARGYTVLEATDGENALEVAEQHPGKIHLLVTDVVMPGLSGGQVAELLSARRPGLKVLFLSGYTDDAVVRHGVLQAKTAFLQKPYTPTSISLKVREVLDQSGESAVAAV